MVGIGMAAWRLGLEAFQVIGLRTMKIAAGGLAGKAEAERMVADKFEAGLALQTMALTGALGLSAASASAKAVAHHRRKVIENRRRLYKR